MDLLGVFLLALIGGLLIGAAVGYRSGRVAGFHEQVSRYGAGQWHDPSDEAGA